jgi:hypothetical protein
MGEIWYSGKAYKVKARFSPIIGQKIFTWVIERIYFSMRVLDSNAVKKALPRIIHSLGFLTLIAKH